MSIVTPSVADTQAVTYSVPPEKSSPCEKSSPSEKASHRPLQRISEVRQQQGVSLRTVARHMKTDIATVREQEKPTADLRISELTRWQQVLDVPLVDLLMDSGAPLSQPVMERARLLRMMKTAAAIAEKATNVEVQRLAKMLSEQLVEVMPELAEVSPWHSVGQRRSLDDVGRIVERRLRDDFFVVFRDE